MTSSANATGAPGQQIRAMRESVGLSQQRLADLAGCSLSMVRLVEGGYSPSASHAIDRIILTLVENGAEPAA